MTAAISLLLIFAISFSLVRLSSVALKLTGLPEQNARFQALSALTGTGYTTTESEMVVNYPIRRKIISWLMVFGNLGVVSILSTLMLSMLQLDANVASVLVQLAWIVSVTALFFGVMLNPYIDRIFCTAIGYFLERFTFLGGRNHHRLLQFGSALSLGEHQFFADQSLTYENLKTDLGKLTLLAVKRQSGITELFSSDIAEINPGDSLILFGPDTSHDTFRASQNDEVLPS